MLRDKYIFFIIVMVIVFVGSSIAAADSSSADKEISQFIKQMYGNTDIQVIFNLPPHLRNKTRIKNMSFSKVPDATGDGICLVMIESINATDMSVYVPFKVLVKRVLYAANDSIKKGSVLKQHDLSMKETFLTGNRGLYPLSIDDIVGKSVKRDMAPGEIVTSQILEDVTAIAKGEVVNMTVENKKLLIQAKGVAMEKGKMGEFIRVKSSSGKEVLGKVSGGNAVTIQF
jgi:flagella basal body P-ring formation protein FlgA